MCGRGRHGRPWPCEWDVGREPDRDERSEPPAATPPPVTLNVIEKIGCKTRKQEKTIPLFSMSGRRHALNHNTLSHKFLQNAVWISGQKSQQIHAKIKRYLIINELQDSPWHRPASVTQYVTPETLITVPPQRQPIRNSGEAYDRRKISTFLAGVFPDTFAVKF